MTEQFSTPPANIGFILPHLRAGGVEQGVLRIVNGLDRLKYRPFLFLNTVHGDFLNQLNSDVTVIDGQGKRAIARVRPLSAALSAKAIDVVYSGTNAMNIATCLAINRLDLSRRPAHIISEHTTPTAYFETAKMPTVRRFLARRLYPSADVLAAPLPDLAQMWLEYLKISRPKTAVLTNPVITQSALLTLSEHKKNRDPNLIMAAGRLHHDKGFDVLLDAIALLAKQKPDLRLVLYGEGAQRANLTDQISRLGLRDIVSLPGYKENLPEAFSQAALVVVPSRREGFGNILIEALAAKTPVVATECFGPMAILKSAGAAGRLVPCGHSAALADGISTALADEDARNQAAKLGPIIAANYSHKEAIVAFESLLDQLLA